MANSSALQVDPTKPRNAPENAHLGRRFSEGDYQGYRAHPVFAAQYEALVQNPEVAALWRDLQTAFSERRELETKARVVALVRPILDRENERARADGKPPPPTGQAEAEALADRAIAGKLSKADKDRLRRRCRWRSRRSSTAGTIMGTYMPFTRQGRFVVRWLEKMQLPQGATWALEPNGSRPTAASPATIRRQQVRQADDRRGELRTPA